MSLIFKALGVREGREFSASLKSYFKLHFLNPTCIKERTLKDSKSWAGYVRERKGQNKRKDCILKFRRISAGTVRTGVQAEMPEVGG